MFSRLLFVVCMWLASCAHAYNTQGTDSGFILKEYFRDPSGSLSLDDVQKAEGWKPFRGNMALGFTDDAIWIRATPLITQSMPERVVVRIGAPYLDEVELFRPDERGLYTDKWVGDTFDYAQREIAVNNFAFFWQLPGSANKSLPIYARIKSSSSMLITLELLDAMQFQKMWESELLVFGFVAGSILLLSLLSFIQSLIYLDKVVLSFAVYQIFALAMSLGITGLSAIFIFNRQAQAHYFTSYAVFCNVLAGLFFYRMLLKEMKVTRWSDPFIITASVVSLCAIAVFATGHERLGLEINVYLVVAILLVLIPLFLYGIYLTFQALSWPLVLVFLLATVSVLIMVLPLLGLLDFGRFTPYYAVLHSFILALAFACTLFYRRLMTLRDGIRVQVEYERSLKDNELIRQDRDEKEKFLAMLVHELRTPLSVIRLVADGFKNDALPDAAMRRIQHVRQAVTDINQVIERTVVADQLERGDTPLQRVVCELPEIARLVLMENERAARTVLQVEGEVAPVTSDPMLIKTVLANLVDNAIKYSPPDTSVKMTFSSVQRGQRQGVLTVVSNQASYAGRPDPERVFQKYYRSTGARRNSGSGLGLFLVSGLAETLGGEVRYRTDLEDVVFEFWLPV